MTTMIDYFIQHYIAFIVIMAVSTVDGTVIMIFINQEDGTKLDLRGQIIESELFTFMIAILALSMYYMTYY